MIEASEFIEMVKNAPKKEYKIDLISFNPIERLTPEQFKLYNRLFSSWLRPSKSELKFKMSKKDFYNGLRKDLRQRETIVILKYNNLYYGVHMSGYLGSNQKEIKNSVIIDTLCWLSIKRPKKEDFYEPLILHLLKYSHWKKMQFIELKTRS